MKVFDAQGKMLIKFLDNERLNYGKHIFSLDTKKEKLSKGTYYYLLKIDGFTYKKKSFVVY